MRPFNEFVSAIILYQIFTLLPSSSLVCQDSDSEASNLANRSNVWPDTFWHTAFCLWNCEKQNTTTFLILSNNQSEKRISWSSPDKELLNFGLNPRKQIVMLIHGFQGNQDSERRWFRETSSMLAKKDSSNVIFVDWHHRSRVYNYLSAVDRIKEIAHDIQRMVNRFAELYPSFDTTNIHPIGHSLGAHVAGLFGQLMDRNLKQITALDPTGIAVTSKSPEEKLSADDAKLVVAFHTDSDYLGTKDSIADFDLSVNDGAAQPMCSLWQMGIGSNPFFCDHSSIREYSAVYVGKCINVAYLCESFEDFTAGHCAFCERDSKDCVAFGQEWQHELWGGSTFRPPNFNQKKPHINLPWIRGPKARRYFFKTSAEKPFCMFTYQVVVKVPDNFQERIPKSIQLVIVSPGKSSHKLTVERLKSKQVPKVFNTFGKPMTVLGANIFTGLATFEHHLKEFHSMPLKFTLAKLPKELISVTSGVRNGVTNGTHVEVFVNFMSDVSYKSRAAHSGPVTIEQLSD